MDLDNAIAWFIFAILIGLLFAGAIIVFALLGTAVGAFIGWVIHISPLRSFVEKGFQVFGFNAEGLLMHIGATLGFVTGFVKGLITIKKEEK